MIIAFTLGLFLLNWTPEAINSTLSRFFKQLNGMQFAINVSISKKESNGLKFIHLTTLYKDMLLLCYFIWRMVGTYFMACFAKKKVKAVVKIKFLKTMWVLASSLVWIMVLWKPGGRQQPESIVTLAGVAWQAQFLCACHVSPVNFPCICLHHTMQLHNLAFLHYIGMNQKWLTPIYLYCLSRMVPPAYIQDNMSNSIHNG